MTPAGLGLERLDAHPAAPLVPDGLGRALHDALRAASEDDDVEDDFEDDFGDDFGDDLEGDFQFDDDLEPQPFDLAVWGACAADPTLFLDPAPPLGRVVEDLGLASDGRWLGPAGFNFDRWQAGRRLISIARRNDLDHAQALVVLTVLTIFEETLRVYEAIAARQNGDPATQAGQVDAMTALLDPQTLGSAGPTGRTVRDVLGDLSDPAVAAAVFDEIELDDPTTAQAVVLFAELLEPMVPRPGRVAVRWLRGRAHDALGDVLAAEADFRAAESLDPNWAIVLVELARIASDRGDAERGLALLRRAGAPDDEELLMLLQRFRPAPRQDLGRNAPCWCGSGRKYKQCHLRNEQLPLGERASWLYRKAGMFLQENRRAEVIEVALARSRFDESPDAILRAMAEPLVGDAVLFEGGAFAEFLATRGPLLPADELLLGQQWVLASRSVHEVLDVQPGTGLRLRDVRTGDVHEVRERTASREVSAGMLICARVVPIDGTMQFFGGLEPVSIGERDALIALLDADPEPAELVAFLSRRFAPTQFHNTESEPLVFCEATLRVDDPDELAEALTAEFGEPEYEQPEYDLSTVRWHETVETHGMTRIRATFTLDGSELTVSTNSAARQDRALDTVRRLAPAAVVINDERSPLRDEKDLARLSATNPGGPEANVLDPGDAEVAAAMAHVMRQMEDAWLDERIPALGGRTPRQCAADPTRRPDVVALLDSFPHVPGGMDVDRLRAELGLT